MITRWPSIPDITTDPTTWGEALRTIKQLLEMLTGQRTGAPAPTPRVYKNLVRPGMDNSPIPKEQLKDCDIWIDIENNNKLHFWDGDLKVWVETT